MRQYTEQQRDVEQYNEMTRQRDAAILRLTLWKLYHLEKTGRGVDSQLARLMEDLATESDKLDELRRVVSESKAQYARINEQMLVLKKQVQQKQRAYDNKKNDITPIDQKISIFKDKIASISKTIELQTAELENQERATAKYQQELQVAISQKDQFEKNNEAQSRAAGLDLSEEDLQEYERLKALYTRQTSQQEAEINTAKRQLDTEEKKLATLEAREKQLKYRESSLSGDIVNLKRQIEVLTNEVNEIKDNYKSKKEKLNEKIRIREARTARETELHARLQEATEYLLKYNAYVHENERDAKLREDTETMKRLIPGVRGFVHNLCTPKQRKFQTAVSTVLGKNYNSIIVDTFAVGQQCINYMKEQRSGMATFIPLDSVSVHPISSNLRGISDSVRLAIDSIDFDPELLPAMNYVCGNTIICDDLNVAKYVRWTKKYDVKAVTLDGSVIHKAGLMTGGAVENNRGIVWNDTEINNKKKIKEDCTAELNKLSMEKSSFAEDELQREINHLTISMNSKRDSIAEAQHTLENRESELRVITQQHSSLYEKLEEIRERVSRFRDQYNTAMESVRGIQESIFGDFVARIGVASIEDYESAHSGYITEVAAQRLSFTKKISQAEKVLQFEIRKKSEIEARLQKLRSDLTTEQTKLNEFLQEKEVLVRQLSQIEEEIETLNVELNRKKTEADDFKALHASRQSEYAESQKTYDEIRRNIVYQQELLDKVLMGRIKTLRNCKIESLQLPLSQGSLDLLPLDDAFIGVSVNGTQNVASYNEDVEFTDDNNNESAEENTQERRSGRTAKERAREILDQIVIDYDGLEQRFKDDDDEATEELLSLEIKQLNSNLDQMTINTRAQERLEYSKEKLDEVAREFDIARQEAKIAREEYDKVKTKRKELFLKAFQHISGVIDSIYKELTKTKTFPLGGTAYLSLTDETEPYLGGLNYVVMPPMKRFTAMAALSGGEKTMAALALLFAIHSYHPSPFFVLDEVDAALDNANVSNIAKYIKHHAGPGFQFIVISLKNGLFEHSQSLVGIYRDQDVNSSRALMMDLQVYDERPANSRSSKEQNGNGTVGESQQQKEPTEEDINQDLAGEADDEDAEMADV